MPVDTLTHETALTADRRAARQQRARRLQGSSGDDVFTSGDDAGWETGTEMTTGATTEFEQAQGEVDWVSVEDCAACNKYPHFSDYTLGNEPDNFD